MEFNDLPPDALAATAERERIAALPVLARHAVATLGSRTKLGGTVRTATSATCFQELPAARVGDEVHYPDGTVAHITSGAGFAAIDDGKPLAIVGSHVSNGDVIAESLQSSMEILVLDGLPPIPGFLDPRFVPSQQRH
ncbi:putative Zn-binding protein involved in type VI secretion [Paraburkholderia phenoliruptrix]|uniref:PAAR domain-containing protein n=1 Tax=Paraburkholderia phenoliruptrix TaxID=252970 RepID=UPI0028576E39|nr:PAAR domain-containing protein [Paraburkholderia phenoliruptrix]MDR6419392.1 putative Zn-binding protein involved in type VI secretion [Paraburkholderia phenoliruptrix]